MTTVAEQQVIFSDEAVRSAVAEVVAGLGLFATAESTPPVVVHATTVMDGVVLSWYQCPSDAGQVVDRVLSVSRNGVLIGHDQYLQDIPIRWVAAAGVAYRRMRRDQGADLSDIATHERRGFGHRARLVKLNQAEENGAST